jgi:hypothetical protein
MVIERVRRGMCGAEKLQAFGRRLALAAGDGKIEIQSSSGSPKALYDGISPEVPENNKAVVEETETESEKWG